MLCDGSEEENLAVIIDAYDLFFALMSRHEVKLEYVTFLMMKNTQ